MVNINGVSKEVHIITNKENNKMMLSKPDDTFSVGDVVDWNSMKFLVTDIDENQQIQTKGIIQLCTQNLNFYDQNHILYQIPCIINSNVNLDTDENKFIEVPSTTLILRLPSTEITMQIKRGQIYTLGSQSYVIKDINDIVEPGLLKMEIEYSPEEQESHSFEITILNGNSIQIAQSQSLTINCTLTDNGETVLSPTLLYSSSNEEIATISNIGEVTILGLGTVSFLVSMASDSSVNDSISVEIVEDEQDNITYSIEGNSEIVKGYSQNYIAKKYNNGVLIEGAEFTFSVIPGSTPVSAYTLSVIDVDECSIVANSATYYITLRATDNSNSEYGEKQIKLKNLF